MITPEEQSAIDAYTGPVQKIPRGASSYMDCRWDPAVNKLRPVREDGEFLTGDEARMEYRRNMAGGFKQSAEVAKRRAKVRELAPAMTTKAIALLLGVKPHIIRDDLRRLGIKAQQPCRKGKGGKFSAEKPGRIEDIKSAVKAGCKGPTDIARATGLCRSTVARYLKEIYG